MAITTKKVDTANAIIEAKISQDRLKTLENKIAQNAAKDMKVDGFRKGKVPAHVVKARYGNKLVEDAKNEAIREVYEEALKELNVEPTSIIGEPRVSKFEEKDGEIDVEIEIALRPEIKLDGYKELIPEIKTPEVDDKDVQTRMEDMIKSSAPIEKIKTKRALKSGDHTLIDFEGFLDGEPFTGGKADGYNLEIGSGSFIPGFEDQMIGMKSEEMKEINVTFPEQYQSADLAGKEVMFKVTLLEIQEKVIPKEADADMLKKFLPNEEAPTQEKLVEAIQKQIIAEKESKIFQEETKPKFVEELVEKYKIDLPKGIVEQEMDMAFRNALSTMTEDDIKKYTTDAEAAKEKREEYRKDAEDSVKLTFIVDELAKQESVDVNDQEVMQAIYMEAFQSGQEPQAYLKQYEDQGLLPAVKMAIIEDKLFTKLFNESKSEEKK